MLLVPAAAANLLAKGHPERNLDADLGVARMFIAIRAVWVMRWPRVIGLAVVRAIDANYQTAAYRRLAATPSVTRLGWFKRR